AGGRLRSMPGGVMSCGCTAGVTLETQLRTANYHSDTHALVLIISGDLICFLFFNRPLFLDTPHITQPEITLYL
ncbi:hypothetical protein, partial [Klebsiella michiganensis]|uniref:hypothetical protein n=1 Tax=Klebsiella michiganensis TaxID=1134687 RepID=UPI0025A01EE1